MQALLKNYEDKIDDWRTRRRRKSWSSNAARNRVQPLRLDSSFAKRFDAALNCSGTLHATAHARSATNCRRAPSRPRPAPSPTACTVRRQPPHAAAREPLWKKFLDKFDEPIIKILLAAALLSMFVDLFKAQRHARRPAALGVVARAGRRGRCVAARSAVAAGARCSAWPSFCSSAWRRAGHPVVEGLAVMVAVILATGVAFLSEYKSDREFEVLNAHKESLRVKVTARRGSSTPFRSKKSSSATWSLLETGDEIPADGRLVKATELYVDQSLMTGESEPVQEAAGPGRRRADGPDQPGCLYRGTQVVDGVGQMIVTEVGDATTRPDRPAAVGRRRRGRGSRPTTADEPRPAAS